MAFITNITTTPVVNSIGENGLPRFVDNRHGNIRGGGTISDSTNFSASTFGEGNEVVTIVSGAGPVEGAITTARFNGGTQVVNAIQTTIAGNTNTTLQGAQSNSAENAFTPLQVNVVRTYYYKEAIIAGKWNEFTGAFTEGPSNNTSSGVYNIVRGLDNSSDVRFSGTDLAANPTQDRPGRLTYRDGSPTPVTGAYAARYNW